jgi:uncharacterized cupredoxin-like copper-binding protein
VTGRAAVVFVGLAAVVIGGCGGGADDETTTAGSTEAPAGEKIPVVGKEFSYDPPTVTLKAGQPFTIVLKNTGSIEHDITVDDAKFKLTVPGNDTREKAIKVEKPGTYQFYCSLPGHNSAGMKGELTVTAVS